VRFAVAGAGITGLAAAWELRLLHPDADITVFEPGHIGGKLRTSSFAGRPVDEGADAFLARVPEGRELCAELGLDGALVSPAVGSAYVAAGRNLHRLPEGLVLGVPVQPSSLRGSPLVRADAADRVAAEPTLPGEPLAAGEDPSIGSLIRRRFGDDVLERLVDPLIGSINAGDCDRLSLRAAAPQLAAAAERSGSLVEGLRAAPTPAPEGAPVFWALPTGMASLVDALAGRLAATGVQFVTESLENLADVAGSGAGADGVVLATPAPTTGALVGRAGATTAAAILRAIPHSSPVLVSLAFRRGDVGHPLDASGLLVPKPERRMLTACSFASTKWAHLGDADPSTVVLRASAGRFGDDRAYGIDDDVLVAAMLDDLHALLRLAGDPLQVRVSRWRNGFPQYEPGHLDRISAAEADVAAVAPRVALAGAAYRGIGIPACIRQGRAAARGLAHQDVPRQRPDTAPTGAI
jgi:oxygen-dependent protoporphyrinogen oxidase